MSEEREGCHDARSTQGGGVDAWSGPTRLAFPIAVVLVVIGGMGDVHFMFQLPAAPGPTPGALALLLAQMGAVGAATALLSSLASLFQ